MTVEFWTSQVSAPRRAADYATAMEAAGWSGMSTVDSQNLSGDPFLFLGMGAAATTNLHVMTSVSNPVTRHPAALASSALSVQHLSGGRMTLGIGRGDSALAYLGRSPARLAPFEHYLRTLRSYLSLEAVSFEDCAIADELARPVEALELAERPEASEIHWASRAGVSRVPIEVAATGPKVIAIGARHADRVLFALGAEPARIAWGVAEARRAAEQSNRDPDELRFGAYVPVVVHDDLHRGRDIGRAGTSLFARFSVMHGDVHAPTSDGDRAVLENVRANYNMNKHARQGSRQSEQLTDDFLDRFAIIGGEQECIDRLGELVDLGIDKFLVSGAHFGASDPEVADSALRFIRSVAPRVST